MNIHRYCESAGTHFSVVIMVFFNCQSFWTFIDPMVSDEVKMQLMALRDAESDIMKCRVSPPFPPSLHPPSPSPSIPPLSPPPSPSIPPSLSLLYPSLSLPPLSPLSPRITNSPPPSRPVMAEDHAVQISSGTISRRPSKAPGTSSVSHVMYRFSPPEYM